MKMTVLVGRKAPDFTVSAVLADGTILDSFNREKCLWIELFSLTIFHFFKTIFTLPMLFFSA